jgi:hypothetical protein
MGGSENRCLFHQKLRSGGSSFRRWTGPFFIGGGMETQPCCAYHNEDNP